MAGQIVRPNPSLMDGMSHPAVCRHCRHVHDAGQAATVQRYSDCSVWRCPNCKVLIDDRPQSWGGSVTGQAARDLMARTEEAGIRWL